jgi:serine/threonine protein kinase
MAEIQPEAPIKILEERMGHTLFNLLKQQNPHNIQIEGVDQSNQTFNCNVNMDNPKDMIGVGDTSVVFEGEMIQGETHKKVAVKVLAPDTSSTNTSGKPNWNEFVDEAILLSEAEHPNIARFLALASVPVGNTEVPVIIRELFSGSLRKSGEINLLELQQTKNMVEQIASALEYLNTQHNVFPVDLTPENIMVREDGTFALGDLNFVADKNGTGEVGFSEIYSAPEHLKPGLKPDVLRKLATTQSEIYNLGLVSYVALGGREPDEFDRALTSEFIKPTNDISPQILEVLKKATRNKPEERYNSLQEFSQAFSNAIG